MSNNMMYFGMRGNMQWVPAAKVEMGRSQGRASSNTKFSNGGTYIASSTTGARVYTLDWPMRKNSFERLAHVVNCAERLYPLTGGTLSAPTIIDDNIYFLDPFAMEQNLIPAYWAAMYHVGRGAPSLGGVDTSLDTYSTPNSNNYPPIAQQVVEGARTLWIPVPDGYTFHLGVHGLQFGSVSVRVTTDEGTATDMTMMSVNTTTRTNYSYTPSSAGGVEISIAGTDSNKTYISGMIAQIRPIGKSVPDGGFIPGRGHSGCATEAGLEESGYSVALGLEQFAMTLEEVGAWS